MTSRASNTYTTSHQGDLALDVQQGFSLVEVLVAIVVLSFGLLGMVGMQAFSLQSNREARLQGQAAQRLGRRPTTGELASEYLQATRTAAGELGKLVRAGLRRTTRNGRR